MTRVYKVVFYAVDHDDLSTEDVRDIVENTRYPNDSLGPHVLSIDHREVEWTDDHPLNKKNTSRAALDALFADSPSRLV